MCNGLQSALAQNPPKNTTTPAASLSALDHLDFNSMEIILEAFPPCPYETGSNTSSEDEYR